MIPTGDEDAKALASTRKEYVNICTDCECRFREEEWEACLDIEGMPRLRHQRTGPKGTLDGPITNCGTNLDITSGNPA
eukprot:12881964-Prorocentrum_lima.AAC.1